MHSATWQKGDGDAYALHCVRLFSRIIFAGLIPAMGRQAENVLKACAPISLEDPAWRGAILEILQGITHELTQMTQPLCHRQRKRDVWWL